MKKKAEWPRKLRSQDWFGGTGKNAIMEIAGKLEHYADERAFENLVICAAPRTLGDLRKLLSHQVKEKTLAEIDRNCVSVPTDQLIATVKSVVFPG